MTARTALAAPDEEPRPAVSTGKITAEQVVSSAITVDKITAGKLTASDVHNGSIVANAYMSGPAAPSATSPREGTADGTDEDWDFGGEWDLDSVGEAVGDDDGTLEEERQKEVPALPLDRVVGDDAPPVAEVLDKARRPGEVDVQNADIVGVGRDLLLAETPQNELVVGVHLDSSSVGATGAGTPVAVTPIVEAPADAPPVDSSAGRVSADPLPGFALVVVLIGWCVLQLATTTLAVVVALSLGALGGGLAVVATGRMVRDARRARRARRGGGRR